MTLAITTARTADVPHIVMLMQQCFTDAYGEAWQVDDLPAVLAMPGTRARLAYDDAQQPLGFYLWRQTLDEAELLLIAVHPNRRQQGHGGQLMADMIDEAGRAGVVTLFLEVREGNNAAACLYHGYGFRQIGRRRGYYRGRDGRSHDAITLRLDVAGCQSGSAR